MQCMFCWMELGLLRIGSFRILESWPCRQPEAGISHVGAITQERMVWTNRLLVV